MRKWSTVLVLLIAVFSMFGCSDDDSNEVGKGAKYRVVLNSQEILIVIQKFW